MQLVGFVNAVITSQIRFKDQLDIILPIVKKTQLGKNEYLSIISKAEMLRNQTRDLISTMMEISQGYCEAIPKRSKSVMAYIQEKEMPLIYNLINSICGIHNQIIADLTQLSLLSNLSMPSIDPFIGGYNADQHPMTRDDLLNIQRDISKNTMSFL